MDESSKNPAADALRAGKPLGFGELLEGLKDPTLPASVLDALAGMKVAGFELAQHPNISIRGLRTLVANFYYSRVVMNAVLEHPHCTVGLKREMARENRGAINQVLAESPLTPTDVLEDLGKHPSVGLCALVAANPKTPRTTLEALYKGYRCHPSLAGNPKLPKKFLTELASSLGYETNIRLAQNPNLPEKAFRVLARPQNYVQVRLTIVRREDCPPAVLGQLLNDPYAKIRSLAVANPNTPREVVVEFGKTRRSGAVQLAVRKRLAKGIAL
jgi:hypothetical protein